MLKEKAFSNVIQSSKTHRLFGQYVIKHGFQFKSAAIVFAVIGASLFIIWLEGHMIVSRVLESNAISNPEVVSELSLLTEITAKTAILLSAISIGLVLFLSHFVAGPIYRFEKTLEEIRDGNLTVQVRLRDHDEFKDTADIFNQTLAGLRSKLKKDRATLDAFLEKSKELSENLKKAGHSAEAIRLDHLITEFKNTPPNVKIG